MRRTDVNSNGWGLVGGAMLLVGALFVGASPSVSAEDDGTKTVRIESLCGSESQTQTLVAEVKSRLPDYEVHLGGGEEEGGAGTPGVVWANGESETCELQVRTGAETTRLTLASDAEAASIRQAASRVAWLLTATRVPTEAPEAGGEPPQEEAEEEEAAGEETESGESMAREEMETDASASEESETQGEKPPEEEGGEGATTEDEASEPSETASETEAADAEDRVWRDVRYQVAIVPPLYEPSFDEPVAPQFAAHLVGVQYGLRGIEFGFANIKTGFARGFQFGGIFNYVGGEVVGAQLSSGANWTMGDVRGVSSAMGGNLADNVNGLQLAGGVNVALGDVSGAQLALGGNLAGGHVEGVQSAAVNVAGGMPGAQIGLLNLSRRVEGFQVGLLNVARDSDVSLGLLSVNWARPLYVNLWEDLTGFSMFELKHGSRRIHNIVVTGYNPFFSEPVGVVGAGLGTHLGRRPLSADIDLLGMYVVPGGGVAPAAWGQLRGTLFFSLTERFALMGGVSLNVLAAEGSGSTIAVSDSVPSINIEESLAWVWPGLHAGLRF